MAIDRTTLFQGPGHIVFDGKAILSADDIKVTIGNDTEDIACNGYGVIGRRRKGRSIKVTCTPLHWDNLTTLLPYAALQIGESVYGTTDKVLQVIPRNGANSGIKLLNAAVTKMPSVTYSAIKRPLGSMEFTGLIANSADPSLDASYYLVEAPGALPQPDLTKIRNGIYTASWGDALVNFGGVDGFELDTDLQLSPTDPDGHGIIDMYLAGLTASVKVTPVGLAWGAVLGALGGAIGADLVHHDLVIKTGSGEAATTVATIPNCQLITGEGEWGNDKRRVGALEFRSVRSAAGGALTPLWTLV